MNSDLYVQALVCGIPEYMIGGLERWINHHIKPGDFLCAVLANDLTEACGRADDTNQHILFAYVEFLHNYAPSQCWGSPEKVRQWAALRSEAQP